MVKGKLYDDFDKPGRIKGAFGFHHFQPSFYSFFDIGNGFFVSFSLRKAAGQRRDFCYIISFLILLNYHMQFHIISSCFHFKFARAGLSSMTGILKENRGSVK